MKKDLITLLLVTPFLFGIVFSFQACVEPPPEKLTRRQKTQADTIYSKLVAGLRAETDSLCEIMMETKLQAVVDSLVQLRKEEEARIRQRLMKNE